MGGKTLARLGAVVFVALAVTATAIESTRKEESPPHPAASLASAPPDPLRQEILRCQQLGEAGPRDPACLRAWAENRERFLGSPPRSSEISAGIPLPGAVQEPSDTPDDPVRKEMNPVAPAQPGEAR